VKYTVKSHEVQAAKITKTEPIFDHGAMVAPDRGLILVLDDGSREKWVADKSGVVPQIGDFVITDPELHIRVVVPAARFAVMFQEIE
jgi:hypothetical protein